MISGPFAKVERLHGGLKIRLGRRMNQWKILNAKLRILCLIQLAREPL